MTLSAAIYIFLLERDWFTRCILDVTPGFFDAAKNRLGHRHIVKIKRHLVAVLISPGKEFQRCTGIGGFVLYLVHQDKSRARDWPGIFAALVGQNLIKAPGPISTCGSGLESSFIGLDKTAACVLHQGVGHLVLLGI